MIIPILRIIHIVAGVAWAGGAFLLAGFIEPTVHALGADGSKFMQHLSGPGRFSTYMTGGALLNSVAGIILYVMVGSFSSEWITSRHGLGLTIGGIAGLIAFVYGGAVTGSLATRIGQLGKEMASIGGPPSPQQINEMHDLQAKIARSGRISALLLLIAVTGMAVS